MAGDLLFSAHVLQQMCNVVDGDGFTGCLESPGHRALFHNLTVWR